MRDLKFNQLVAAHTLKRNQQFSINSKHHVVMDVVDQIETGLAIYQAQKQYMNVLEEIVKLNQVNLKVLIDQCRSTIDIGTKRILMGKVQEVYVNLTNLSEVLNG